MVKRAWLSVTPEPERELPRAVATLRCGAVPDPAAIATEAARIERLLLHGSEREWDAYLHAVIGLLEAGSGREPEGSLAEASAVAIDVIANHHNLLLGLPGRGAERTAADRARLDRLYETTRGRA